MLEYVQEFGTVIQQLMIEPEVADVLDELDTHFQMQYKSYLTKRVREEYGIDENVALVDERAQVTFAGVE